MTTEEVSEEKRAKLCHEDEEESQEEHKNKFVNDGSFLELFRKKMTEKPESSQKNTSSSTDPTAVTGYQQSLKLIQAGVGRPKALLKSIELREKRKRRREELEEQKRIEESGSDESWKKYLAEMKSYEEHLCIDKDSSARPLVK